MSSNTLCFVPLVQKIFRVGAFMTKTRSKYTHIWEVGTSKYYIGIYRLPYSCRSIVDRLILPFYSKWGLKVTLPLNLNACKYINHGILCFKWCICYFWNKTSGQDQMSWAHPLLVKKAIWNLMLSEPTAARSHCNPSRIRLSLCGNSGPGWAGHSNQLCV